MVNFCSIISLCVFIFPFTRASAGGVYHNPQHGSQPVMPQPFLPKPPAMGPHQTHFYPESVGPGSQPAPPKSQPVSLLANIHSNSLKGYIQFTPDVLTNKKTLIRAHIVGGNAGDLFNWKIYSLPLQRNDPTSSCKSIGSGAMLIDMTSLFGPIPNDKEVTIHADLDIFGENSLMGRTLMISSLISNDASCSTILPSQKNIYKAKFHAPVSGNAYLFKSVFGIGLLSQLSYSNGTRRDSHHNWALIEVNDASPEAYFENVKSNCASLKGISLLGSDSTGSNQISISTEMPSVRGRTYSVMRSVQFDPLATVYVVIFSDFNPNAIMACSPLSLVKAKTAVAKFNYPEVRGSIIFTQPSPLEPTNVHVDLNLNANVFSYGIDRLPMIKRRQQELKKCPNILERIYNPYHIDPNNVPSQGKGTTDQYAVGDLSGKYGTLAGKTNENTHTLDFNLPLFGYFSVIGRAVVIYASDGPPMACANVELEANMTTAFSTFDIPIQGQFIFRQPANDCQEDTYIYIEVSKPDGQNVGKTVNHPWHVHTFPVQAGFEHLSTTECKPAGPHFNPYNVSTDCIYQRDCTIFTPLRCEMGDTASKLGTLDIPPYRALPSGEPDVGKYYFVDDDLPLCGKTSTIGASVVIHEADFGSPRLTCANIIEYKPKN